MVDKTFTNTKLAQDFLDGFNPTLSYTLSNKSTFSISDWETLTTLKKTEIITNMATFGFTAED